MNLADESATSSAKTPKWLNTEDARLYYICIASFKFVILIGYNSIFFILNDMNMFIVNQTNNFGA